jgi:hypothetical protein
MADLLTHTNHAPEARRLKHRALVKQVWVKLLKYCTWWCIISASSGYHYYVNFIVDLVNMCISEWNTSLKLFEVFKEFQNEGGYEINKKIESLRFWSKWQVFSSYVLAYKDLWKVFHKLWCLEQFNMLIWIEHYNHTLWDIVWSK